MYFKNTVIGNIPEHFVQLGYKIGKKIMFTSGCSV